MQCEEGPAKCRPFSFGLSKNRAWGTPGCKFKTTSLRHRQKRRAAMANAIRQWRMVHDVYAAGVGWTGMEVFEDPAFMRYLPEYLDEEAGGNDKWQKGKCLRNRLKAWNRW